MSIDLDKLVAPPVSEVGFSFVTNDPIVDPYDIRKVHDLYRGRFPRLERQPPVNALDVGGIASFATTVSETDAGIPPRWWFVSDDDTQLVQVQERFISFNWRRNVHPVIPVTYPGYINLRSDAQKLIHNYLDTKHEAGELVSAPAAAQLMYDNVIIYASDQNGIGFGDILRNWASSDPAVPLFNWSMSWFENMSPVADQVRGTMPTDLLSVNLALVSVLGNDGNVSSGIRMQLTAVKKATSWEEGFAFFDSAHSYMRTAFRRILTDKILASWERK